MSTAATTADVLPATRWAAVRRTLWRLRWIPVALGAATVLVLGLVGFGKMGTLAAGGICYPATAAAHCVPLGWSDRIYFTLQLFKGTTNGVPPYPVTIEVARWLALGTTVYALYRALAPVLSERWTRYRIGRLARGHVVVCGLGSCGGRIASAFRSAGADVVTIELGPTTAQRQEHRQRGMLLVEGDATAREVLSAARLHTAAAVVVCCGDDAVNARVALLVRSLAGEGPGAPRCFVQVDDPEVRSLLEGGAAGAAHARFELFNVFELGPRALLDGYPSFLGSPDAPDAPDAGAAGGAGDGAGTGAAGAAPAIVVAGDGQMAASILVEAARRRFITPDVSEPLRVVLLAEGAAGLAARLVARYPPLHEACMISPVPLEQGSPPASCDLVPAGGFLAGCFVCFDDEDLSLRTALRLRRQIDRTVPVVLCSLWQDDAGPLLALASVDAVEHVEGVGLLDLLCQPRVLLDGDNEVIARAIHAGYLADELRRNPAAKDNPSLVPWERLPEELRQSNRAQAAGAREVLARAGFALVAADGWAAPVELTDDEAQLLARYEHERWMRDLTARGWVYGAVKDPARRQHPALVDYDQLDALDRRRDVDAVHRMPRYLAYHGIAVARPATTRADAPAPAAVTTTAVSHGGSPSSSTAVAAADAASSARRLASVPRRAR